jgi:hypothetical protein
MMRTMFRVYAYTTIVMLAGGALAAQEKRTDPSCERVIEQRVQGLFRDRLRISEQGMIYVRGWSPGMI